MVLVYGVAAMSSTELRYCYSNRLLSQCMKGTPAATGKLSGEMSQALSALHLQHTSGDQPTPTCICTTYLAKSYKSAARSPSSADLLGTGDDVRA
jgi:hypothetical protein